MDDDRNKAHDRLGDLPIKLVEWLQGEAEKRELDATEVAAVLGIVLEGLLKGTYEGDDLRREAAKFSAIFNHVMQIDSPVRERLN